MVTIITGDKNVGKTTRLAHWQAAEGRGAGFCCKKVLIDGMFLGYDLLFFPDYETVPFIRLATDNDRDDPEKIVRHRFAFHRPVFSLAEQRAEEADASTPFFMDEIGGLELAGQGFDALFRLALTKFTDIRVVFRKRCLNELIGYYRLEEYKVIDLIF